MVINIPKCEFDACFLGQFLISLDEGEDVKLQEIAFRLIDMTANRKSLDNIITAYEESLKKDKIDKRNSTAP